MISWKECVNRSAGNEKIQDIRTYLKRQTETYKSPIDRFYTEVKKIIGFCTDIRILEENDFLGPLLYVGIISKTENYLREIMIDCIKICPICKNATANHNISFGSVVWQRNGDFERGVFENESFSDISIVKKELRNCLHIEIEKGESVEGLLGEFDKLCQMRHAIVHSSRILAGKNAIQLNIPSSNDKMVIKIGYAELQECASICTAFVMAFNLKLFKEMIKRWAITWRQMEFWDTEKENEYFSEIWDIFSSVIDREDDQLAEMTKIKCKNAIRREFRLY